jgi:hypothetical protein
MKAIFYIVSIVFVFAVNSCNDTTSSFSRTASQIHYSNHARCRMSCRHIDESEVKEILAKGEINYAKSDLNKDACHRRYALEGISHDNQQLRIIVAECNDKLTVITVIDLGREWPCECN